MPFYDFLGKMPLGITYSTSDRNLLSLHVKKSMQ